LKKAENICELDSADEKLSVSEKINNFTNFMNFKLKKGWALALKYSQDCKFSHDSPKNVL